MSQKIIIPFGDRNDMLRSVVPDYDFNDPENDAVKLAHTLLPIS